MWLIYSDTDNTMKHLLVTGGCGFIGSNFVRLALDAGYRVTNLDKLTYAGNLANLRDVDGRDDYRFVRGDICDAETVKGLFEQNAFDGVIHFAAESHVDRSILDATEFVRTNVVGTQVLLAGALEAGGVRFVQVSTDEVYGSLGDSGYFTEDTPLQPNSPYSASKASADLMVRAYHHTYGLDAVVTRCSNNYGPYQFPEKLIPLFVTNAMEGHKLPVYGDGLYVRDWLYVDDHCRALLAVFEKGEAGRVYNIGGHNEMTNLDITRLILRETGRDESLVTHVKDRPGHDRRYAIDNTRITTELGWQPTLQPEEGLKRTIAWYRENETWWREVKSGAYREYYRRQYGSK